MSVIFLFNLRNYFKILKKMFKILFECNGKRLPEESLKCVCIAWLLKIILDS